MPPDQRLQPRCIGCSPGRADERPNLFQTVGVNWKVNLAKNVFVDIDQPVNQIFNFGIVAFAKFGQGAGIKTAIMVDGGIGVLIDFFQKLLPDLGFVIRGIGPKGMIGCSIILADQQTDQVVKLLVRNALDIQKEFHRLAGQFGEFLQVDFLLTDGQSLQFRFMDNRRRILGSLFAFSRFEGVGKLFDREESLFLVLVDSF